MLGKIRAITTKWKVSKIAKATETSGQKEAIPARRPVPFAGLSWSNGSAMEDPIDHKVPRCHARSNDEHCGDDVSIDLPVG